MGREDQGERQTDRLPTGLREPLLELSMVFVLPRSSSQICAVV